jgi:hypothetical protein
MAKCPYPNRCAPACADAFWKAIAACKKESTAMIDAMGKAATDAYGACSLACTTHKDPCIGAATESECRCSDECEKKIPPEAKGKFDEYKRCMAKATAPCQ